MLLTLLLYLCTAATRSNQGAAGSFIFFPKNVTLLQDLQVEFLCRHSTASRIVWSVNGTYLYSFDYDTQYISSQQNLYSDGMKVYRLFVATIPEYNGTTIQCHARFSNGSPEATSEPATLLIQGTLPAVEDLRISVHQLHLSALWAQPFTLIEHDITYCVDVYNKSDQSLLLSECGVNITNYNLFLDNPSPCDSVTIIVTPVNRVGNGTQHNIDGYFFNAPNDALVGNITAYRSENITLFSIAMPYTSLCTCGVAVAILSKDIERTFAMDVVRCDTRNITVCGTLPNNHHYYLRVHITNAAGTGYLNVSISTYDVQVVDISDSSRNNTVFMRFRFSENSSALGAFVILVRLHNDGSVQLNESFYTTSQRHGNTASLSIHQVPLGIYNVLVYDIESNGLLSSPSGEDEMSMTNPAILHGPIAVLGSGQVKFSLDYKCHTDNAPHSTNEVRSVEIRHTANATTININCTLNETSTAHGCIVIIQSTINTYSKLIIKHTPKTSRNEEAVIDLPGEGWYHTRVYPWISSGLLMSDAAWVEDILVTLSDISSDLPTISSVTNHEDTGVVNVTGTIATSAQPYALNRMTFIWVSIALGILVVVMSLLLVAVCVIIVKGKQQTKKSQTEKISSYEQVTVAGQVKQTEVIYDEPQTPPPQPENMQPCVAYAQPQTLHPCVAYEVPRKRK